MFDATLDLMQRIFRDFEFKPGFTTISTPVEEVMKIKKGVLPGFCTPCHLLHKKYGSASAICKWLYRNPCARGKRKTGGR
jgi:hypothetical protein